MTAVLICLTERFVSTEKRAFSVSWALWNRQKCPEIY